MAKQIPCRAMAASIEGAASERFVPYWVALGPKPPSAATRIDYRWQPEPDIGFSDGLAGQRDQSDFRCILHECPVPAGRTSDTFQDLASLLAIGIPSAAATMHISTGAPD